MLRIITLAAALIGCSVAYAQEIWSLMLNTPATAQLQQPAYLADDRFQCRVGGVYSATYASNALPLYSYTYLTRNNVLDSAYKTLMLDRLQARGASVVQGNIQLGLAAALRLGKRSVGLSVQQRTWGVAAIQRPQTAGLLLWGNSAYLGETISEPGASAQLLRWQEVGVGTGGKHNGWQWGVRLKGVLATDALQIRNGSFSLYTAPTGDSLHLSGRYTARWLPADARAGLGAGIDAGVVWQANDRWMLQFAATDLGAVRSCGTTIEADIASLGFSGLAFDALISNADSAVNALSDSLQSVLAPRNDSASFWVPLPGRVSLGTSWRFSDHWYAGLAMDWSVIADVHLLQGLNVPRTSALALYQREHLALGLMAAAGGFNGFSAGAMARAHMHIGSSELRVFATSENLTGLLQPTRMRGFDAAVGASVAF